MIKDDLEERACSMAYQEGVSNFGNKFLVDNCPYRWDSKLGRAWRTGWYDARTRERLGHLFEKYNVKYP